MTCFYVKFFHNSGPFSVTDRGFRLIAYSRSLPSTKTHPGFSNGVLEVKRPGSIILFKKVFLHGVVIRRELMDLYPQVFLQPCRHQPPVTEDSRRLPT